MKKVIFSIIACMPLAVLMMSAVYFGNLWVIVICGLIIALAIPASAVMRPRKAHTIYLCMLVLISTILWCFSDKPNAGFVFSTIPCTYFWGSYIFFNIILVLKKRKRQRLTTT